METSGETSGTGHSFGRLKPSDESGRVEHGYSSSDDSKDTEMAVRVVRRSIEELCAADHHNDAATLTKWLANKTPENFRSWISDPDNFCVVAEAYDRLCGVGLVDRSGEIKLFYLSPGSQRQGVGRAIHAALEAQARKWGLRKLHLDSTILARPFYAALGYRASGEAKPRFGLLRCYSYEKRLESDSYSTVR